MNLVSIIIPIYNVQKYLSRCLDSLLAQTLKDIEIILINDGSRDNSLGICEAYAKKDKRIIVIDQINQGVSVARNTGIAKATGEYIGFVDPDDWLEPNMYELMVNKIKESDCPICFCNYYKDEKNNSVPKDFKIEKDILDKEEITDVIISNMVGADDIMPHYNFVMGCVWRGLYKKSFMDQYGLDFEPGVNIMEDLVFNIRALLKADKLCIVPDHLYHYVQNPTSILHSYKKNMWEDQMRVHELLEQYIIEADLEERMRNRLDMRYVGMAFSAIYNEVQAKNKEDMRNKMIKVKEICADEKFKVSLERIRPIRGSEASGKQEEISEKKVVNKRNSKKGINKKEIIKREVIKKEMPKREITKKEVKKKESNKKEVSKKIGLEKAIKRDKKLNKKNIKVNEQEVNKETQRRFIQIINRKIDKEENKKELAAQDTTARRLSVKKKSVIK